ncbi:MAG: family 10 glycosylhydrolase [bacterium]|nr:family 10 glycosylhydrolase [bacterium]
MKKVIVLILVFVMVILLGFNNKSKLKENDEEELRAIFISYIELSKYVKNQDVNTSKRNIEAMINNISILGFNTVIVQIRSFADAIYESTIYPWSSTVAKTEGENPGYDILDYFIKIAKEKNILLYAWINPYRVRSSGNVVSEKSPAFKYLGTDFLYEDEGLYFNPSKQEVEDLIVDGVLEVINNYLVDGILFDDYFYPNQDLDYLDYLNYLENNDYISFDDYHLMIINKMVKRVHDVCREKKVLFGISPDGNIDNNYKKVFADVKNWLSSDQYVDFIMPQVYYGFFNETQAFKNVIDSWDSLIVNSDIKLYVALGFYKVGTLDKYAKSGEMEWINNSNVIMREIILARNLKYYKGFSLFRYDYLFNDDLKTATTMLEIENMKKILN